MSDQSFMLKHYREKVVPSMMETRKYKNPHQIPKITKVVLNTSVGSSTDIKAAVEDAVHDMTLIAGQKPVKTLTRKAISNFKTRQNQEIGCRVTLRGRMMYEFLERFICMALPRIRDFRGTSPRAFDGRGNYTLGVKDHTIFPEIELDKVKRNLGMDVTIVTTAPTNDEAKELLALMGVPFSDKLKGK